MEYPNKTVWSAHADLMIETRYSDEKLNCSGIPSNKTVCSAHTEFAKFSTHAPNEALFLSENGQKMVQIVQKNDTKSQILDCELDIVPQNPIQSEQNRI